MADCDDHSMDAARVRSTGRSRRIYPALIILVGLVIHSPSLFSGFIYDDYSHRLMMRYPDRAPSPQWNLYDFGVRPNPGDAMYEWDYFPWWTDPDFKIRFFRPVTSFSLLLDYAPFDGWAPGYHLSNLLLFAVFLGLAHRLFVAAGLSERGALWALAFLALEDNHVIPVYWIANRNTLLAGLFVVATALCLHRHVIQKSGVWLAGGLLCFLLACGAKESGIVAYPIAIL